MSGIAKGELKTLELSEVEAINIQEDKHLSDLGFTLRKDDDGHWKILFWELTEIDSDTE